MTAPPCGGDGGARTCRALGWLISCFIALSTVPARSQALLPEASRTLEYERPAKKHHIRAALEELVLFGGGLAHYFTQHEANSLDWDLDYDWKSFRGKLDGSAYALDTNRFDTNFITHPGAGTLYYLAARGNRLSLLESVGYAVASSTMWELLGEFRERMSVNDLLVTPLAGFVVGEATTQLGAFFDRSCPTPVNRALGAILGPSKSLHDAIDGAAPRRDTACDVHGLASGGSHRFRLELSQAAVWEASSTRAGTNEVRLTAGGDVAHLNALRTPGRGWLTFSDGNVASVAGEVGVARGGLSSLDLSGRVVPAGLHYRDLGRASGKGVAGAEVILGILAAVDYNLHQYERPNGKLDRFFVLTVPGTTLVALLRGGETSLELSLDAGASFAGVDAFALPGYLASRPTPRIGSTTRAQGYSHAAGFSLVPRMQVSLRGAEVGVEARTDRLYALRALDRLPISGVRDSISETRRKLVLWLAAGPDEVGMKVVTSASALQRVGSIGAVRRERVELAVAAGVGMLL